MRAKVNENRNEEMRKKLVLRASSTEARKRVDLDPYDEEGWYQLGMALAKEQGPDACIDAFGEGLFYNPFSALLHFGRGRKNIGLGRYWRCISDQTEAIRLSPENWTYWYYRAVAENLNGNLKEAISDFRQCMQLTDAAEHCPLVDWMFLCYVELGDKDGAREVLKLLRDDIVPPDMDYAYLRRIQLYQEKIRPEELIDEEALRRISGSDEDNLELDIVTLLYGLYAYYVYKGEQEKAKEALKELLKHPYPGAFGYIKGEKAAMEWGLMKE